MVGVVAAVDDARQGVFITSRKMFGIDVDFVVPADDEATEVESTRGAGGSAVLAAADVDPPLATSSMTSSICERVVVAAAAAAAIVAVAVVVVVVVVTAAATTGDDADRRPGVDGLSPVRLDDETIFDTRVIKSVCCVTGVETLVDTGVGRLC